MGQQQQQQQCSIASFLFRSSFEKRTHTFVPTKFVFLCFVFVFVDVRRARLVPLFFLGQITNSAIVSFCARLRGLACALTTQAAV